MLLFLPGPGLGDLMTNTNSLAREVTFDSVLQRLNYFPVQELEALRGPVFVRKFIFGDTLEGGGRQCCHLETHLRGAADNVGI